MPAEGGPSAGTARVQIVWTRHARFYIAREGSVICINQPWWDGASTTERGRMVCAFFGMAMPPPGVRYWARCPSDTTPDAMCLNALDLTLLAGLLGVPGLIG
jgi:hypothetical protein